MGAPSGSSPQRKAARSAGISVPSREAISRAAVGRTGSAIPATCRRASEAPRSTAAWGLLGEINRFLVRHAPWELRGAEQAAVLRGASEALLQVAGMAEPVLPTACREIAARLGTETVSY